MHKDDLISWESYEEQGLYVEHPVLVKSVLEDSITGGTSSVTSLETLDAVMSLLKNQAQVRIKNPYQVMLSSSDIRHLYEAYTKLNFKLQLALPQLRFRDWEEFDSRFIDAQNDLDRKIIGRPELDWFEEPTRIVRDAVESGWANELYASVDSGNLVGWPHVVVAMESLKRTYSSASSPDEYANVARSAKGLLEKLSDTVWATGDYQTPLNVKDGPQYIKNRLQTVICAEFEDDESEHLTVLMKAANDFADVVRHRRNPSRYEATIAADSALFLTSILWIALTREK